MSYRIWLSVTKTRKMTHLERQSILQKLQDIAEDTARWDKSGGYAFVDAVVLWLRYAGIEERDRAYQVLLEQIRAGGEYAWLVPDLVDRLNDAKFALQVATVLPLIASLPAEEEPPSLYDITLVSLLKYDDLIPTLNQSYLQRADELLMEGDGYGVYMLWELWIRQPDKYASFVVPRFVSLFTKYSFEARVKILSYWVWCLCVLSSDYTQLDLLLKHLQQAGISANQVRESLQGCVASNPHLRAVCSSLSHFLSML